MSTAIFDAKRCASFFLIYHLMKTFTAVKINEAVGKRVWKISKIRSAYHLNGIFGNSGANSNGTVHPGGKFSEKGNTFRGISFFPLLPEFPKISVPFVNSYSARLFTVILLRKNAKDLKDGGRFPKCLSLLCVSLLVGSVGGRFRTQLQPPGGRGTPANFG